MRYTRWLDHLPPWASWSALWISDVFSGWELLFMALPLMAAAAVETSRWQLSRWRHALEIACLLGLVVCKYLNLGWVIIVIMLLFMLCGARLSLPREQNHRRQIIFMSFLLFLLTTIANTSISFLPMALIWTAIAGLLLFQLNWENASRINKSVTSILSLRRILAWTSIAALIGSALFVILPRPIVGWRPLPFGIHGFAGTTAGLADNLALEDTGIIQGNREIVARILPPPGISIDERKKMESRMSLLTGFRMEQAKDGRWERARHSPPRRDIMFGSPLMDEADTIEYFVYPSPTGLIPLPQGTLVIIPPTNMRIELSQNGMARWSYPMARPMSFRFTLWQLETMTISDRRIERQDLRAADPATIEALYWSLRVAPGDLHPADLVNLLTQDLLTFRYTMDNPSGSAKNPLGDFLTRTRAGHCEYFAHALASALRHRGVVSRVVNGYRLGSWVKEGGYWLVTQNEAHSWVEYVNPDTGAWTTADPTPPGAVSSYFRRWYLSEKLVRMMDAMHFRWDRYVVRFSDTEQQKGLAWIQSQVARSRSLLPDTKTIYIILAVVTALLALPGAWKKRDHIRRLLHTHIPPGTVIALRPLIRSTQIQPHPCETLRGWFNRLSAHRPDRREPLEQLAVLIEENVYGNANIDLGQPIKEEAREWRRK